MHVCHCDDKLAAYHCIDVCLGLAGFTAGCTRSVICLAISASKLLQRDHCSSIIITIYRMDLLYCHLVKSIFTQILNPNIQAQHSKRKI